MRLSRVCAVVCVAASTFAVRAESKNLADYPLRLHIFGRNQTTFYTHGSVDETKGDGRANLFANGEVHGVDFNYACSDKLRASFGFETYAAKWRKPGRELVVLMPVFGKTGSFWTCDLKTDVKDFAYTRHNGSMGQESPAEFKAWMVKHDYDPEHGKNMPAKVEKERSE